MPAFRRAIELQHVLRQLEAANNGLEDNPGAVVELNAIIDRLKVRPQVSPSGVIAFVANPRAADGPVALLLLMALNSMAQGAWAASSFAANRHAAPLFTMRQRARQKSGARWRCAEAGTRCAAFGTGKNLAKSERSSRLEEEEGRIHARLASRFSRRPPPGHAPAAIHMATPA